MTRPSRPEVSDPELRAALDRVGPNIENHAENLDLLSKDIRSIEQYLAESTVRVTAKVRIDYSEEFTDGGYDVLGNYSGGICRYTEWIEWAPEKVGAPRWRVMYTVSRRLGEVDIVERIACAGPTFNGEPEETERKPLIETPVSVRLLAHKHLAKLVEEVGKQVEYAPTAVPDDVPF